MVSDSYEYAEALLNSICAKIPLVDKNDLSIFADILQTLELLGECEGMPKAFIVQARRTASLAKLVILDEVEFEGTLVKITKSIEKMVKAVTRLVTGTNNAKTEPLAVPPAVVSGAIGEIGEIADRPEEEKDNANTRKEKEADEELNTGDLSDLIGKFARQQQQVLEDFEALCLDYEKAEPEAIDGIKRMLHTWKGEFGVINLSDYSKLIHMFEEAFETTSFPAESLFRLKDLLGTKMNSIASGTTLPITPGEINYVFEPVKGFVKEKKVKKLASKDKSKKEKEVIKNDAIHSVVDRSLINDFVSESKEHIDTVESHLLDLESDPTDQERINTIFRSCHTIKGVAAFLGFFDISNLAHRLENLMDIARKKEIVLTAGNIDLLFQGMDCLKAMILSVEQHGTNFQPPETFAAIYERLANPLLAEASVAAEATNERLGTILVAQGHVSKEKVDSALSKQEHGDDRKLGQILIQDKEVPAKIVATALASQVVARQQKNVDETIRIPVERLDHLIDTIGEAVIAQSMIYEELNKNLVLDRTFEKKISQASLIMRQVQELSMSLRMISVKATFMKMARLVRDLSKKTNKLVDLAMEGEETELDKTVVEKISDPLIHMIRNSIDHGIELPEDRRNAGKSERGRIALKAYHRAGSIVIELSDDGRGLNCEKIRQKAIDKGLITEETTQTDNDIFQYIFLPGFSTAEVVTDVSGRGVGMDVVRRNIESIRGSIEIRSELGIGTTFTIKLPLTLAVIDGMIVRSAQESYIIPTHAIIESIRPKNQQIFSVANKGKVIQVRGNLLTLVNLADVLNNPYESISIEDSIVMIVEDMLGKRIGLMVDTILGQQQVVIKNLGGAIGDITGIAGGAIMSDGRVNLILDIGGIVKMATHN